MTITSGLWTTTAVALFIAVGASSVAADDWPHWRGPHHDGISREINWLDEGRPDDVWRGNVGLGHSSFAIAGGRLYTLGYDAKAGLDTVYCLDAATGAEIWRHSYSCAIWDDGHTGGTLTTPAVDGDAVYTSNREGRLFCFDAATGTIRWQRHLAEDFDLTPSRYGFAASPLILDDMLIMNVDRTIAFDKATGEVLWRTEALYGRAFSTPTAFEDAGQPRLAVFNGLGLVILDRSNGRELATHPWARRSETNPATPIVAGDRFFISAGYGEGCALLALDGEGGLTPVWESRVMCNKVGTSVLIDGHLYGFDESMLKCIDLEGQERWRVRGFGMGCLAAAGDRLIIMTSKGELVVADASPEAFRERSRAKVLDGGTYWAVPVLSEGRIYCRNSEGDLVVRDHRPDRVAANGDEGRAEDADRIAALTPGELFARHRAAVGRLAPGQVVHLTGTFERRAEGVIANPMAIQWRAPEAWLFRFDHEWGGRHIGADALGGWTLLGSGLAEPLEASALRGMTETAGIVRWFDLEAAAPVGKYIGDRQFEERMCHVVQIALADGGHVDHFYDAEAGFLRGLDGDTTPLIVYDDYRAFGGITIPTRMTMYEIGTGIMESIEIESVRMPSGDDAVFALPEEVRDMPRTPEQIARADAEARQRWGGLTGGYAAQADADDTQTYFIIVHLGRLALRTPRDDVHPLFEPDESGRWEFATMPGVSISFTRDAGGRATHLTIHQEGRDDVILPRRDAAGSS